jgi:lysophospholipase L1-like esterase
MEIFKKKFICIGLLLISALLAEGGENKPAIFGHFPFPMLDKKGDSALIFINPKGQLSLAAKKKANEEFAIQTLSDGIQVQNLAIRENRTGDYGIIWEEGQALTNHIYFALWTNHKFTSLQKVSQGTDFSFSPELDFDYGNNPWVTWISYTDKTYKVCVKNLSTDETWFLNSPSLSFASQAKIVVSGDNSIWVFWVGQASGRDEIFARVLKDNSWSTSYKINKDNRMPHIFPDASLDTKGFPWLVWTSYDGQDYEIFCSEWNGRRWSKEEKITDNNETDFYPICGLVSSAFPLVVWSRCGPHKTSIVCRYKSQNGWSQERELFQSINPINSGPKLAIHGDQIFVAWESDGKIESRSLFFHQLERAKVPQPETWEGNIPFNSSLDENKYIGFGDSITYGTINNQYAPEKGYIPRLEALLTKTFGPTKIINEGWPGETTINGLGRIQSILEIYLARYLLLMEGTNDVIFTQISMDTTAFNLEQMVLKSLDFGLLPVVSTIIPRSDWRWSQKLYRNRISDLNQKIQEMATNLKVPFVDQFNAFYSFPEQEGGWKSLISDGVHPSEKGYEIMTETWFQQVDILPFPPIHLQAKRVHKSGLFLSQEGNLLTWQSNPKISNPLYFSGYKIYRKEASSPSGTAWKVLAFQRIFRNDYSQKYFDMNINNYVKYSYAISFLRRDGVEGPQSELANEQD